mgnify:CR=1 FL=1
MSRQSRNTIISPANADTSPESSCMAYLERKFNPDHRSESSHTYESARKAAEYGRRAGLLRENPHPYDPRVEIMEITRQIVELRRAKGWTQERVDKLFGYRSKRTSRIEAGYQSLNTTRRFFEHLKRIIEHEDMVKARNTKH